MRLPRAVLSAVAAFALVLGTGAVGASADTPTQPLTLVTPKNGARTTSPYVTFAWQAPAGQADASITVATTSTTRNGVLPTGGKHFVDYSDVPGAAHSYTDKRFAYPPATYYWQATATDAAGVEYRSAVQKFVVPVFFDLSKVRAKAIREPGNGKRAVLVSAVMRCNYAQDQYYTQFTMVTYRGTKALGRSIVAQGNCVGMYPIKTSVVFEPGSLRKGTKLTLKVRGRSTMDSTVRWGGSVIKKANGPVTTLHFTWKG